jgi:hypothetical protein
MDTIIVSLKLLVLIFLTADGSSSSKVQTNRYGGLLSKADHSGPCTEHFIKVGSTQHACLVV